MTKDRRRYVRINIELLVESRGERIWQTTKTMNISEGGIFLKTNRVENPNTFLEIILPLKDERNRNLSIESKVVWSKEEPFVDGMGKEVPAGMGIEFVKFPSPEYREIIRREIIK